MTGMFSHLVVGVSASIFMPVVPFDKSAEIQRTI